jgi:hypothetical protein
MGYAKVTTTLAIYMHLFDDDHAETMAAREAMIRPAAPTSCRCGGLDKHDHAGPACARPGRWSM